MYSLYFSPSGTWWKKVNQTLFNIYRVYCFKSARLELRLFHCLPHNSLHDIYNICFYIEVRIIAMRSRLLVCYHLMIAIDIICHNFLSVSKILICRWSDFCHGKSFLTKKTHTKLWQLPWRKNYFATKWCKRVSICYKFSFTLQLYLLWQIYHHEWQFFILNDCRLIINNREPSKQFNHSESVFDKQKLLL